MCHVVVLTIGTALLSFAQLLMLGILSAERELL